jgi:hypothetical protein
MYAYPHVEISGTSQHIYTNCSILGWLQEGTKTLNVLLETNAIFIFYFYSVVVQVAGGNPHPQEYWLQPQVE